MSRREAIGGRRSGPACEPRYKMTCGPHWPLWGWGRRKSLRAAYSAAERALQWSGVDWVEIKDTRTGKTWRLPPAKPGN